MKTEGNILRLFYGICWIGKALRKLKQELNENQEASDAADMGQLTAPLRSCARYFEPANCRAYARAQATTPCAAVPYSGNKHARFSLVLLTCPHLLFKHSPRPHLLLKASSRTPFPLISQPCVHLPVWTYKSTRLQTLWRRVQLAVQPAAPHRA